MIGYRRIISKIKPRLFTSCLNRGNDRAKLGYWGWRKIFCYSVSMIGCYGYRDYKGFFQNIHIGGTDQKGCWFRTAEALAKNWC